MSTVLCRHPPDYELTQTVAMQPQEKEVMLTKTFTVKNVVEQTTEGQLFRHNAMKVLRSTGEESHDIHTHKSYRYLHVGHIRTVIVAEHSTKYPQAIPSGNGR